MRMVPVGVIVFRRSRWRVLAFLSLYLLFVIAGAGGVVEGVQAKLSAAGVFALVFCALILGLGVAGTIAFGRDAISPRELIWITEEGYGQRVVHPHVLVPWPELVEVSLITRGRVKTVAVKVRSPTLLPRRWVTFNKARASHRYTGAIKALTPIIHHRRDRRFHVALGSAEGHSGRCQGGRRASRRL